MELSDDFYIPTNEFQTAITKDFLTTLPEEVAEQLLDFVTNVPYIQNLISPDRRRAKDMPHDEEGRVIVDLANPHILEDMDYFRPAALHFKKHGCYTFLRPNPNPNSEYKKWINEEKRRCREGFVRESDGEWITGYMYWYMNYCPIMLTRVTEGKKKADRVEDFPETWEGIYLRFHYIHQARENGHHAIELARRGAHPYTEKVFTPQGWKLWEEIKIGDELYGTNGSITKVLDIPYDKEAPYYKITLRDGRCITASDDHLWVVQEGHKSYTQTLSTKRLLEIYAKKRKVSYRVPSGIEHNCFLLKNNGIDLPFKETKVDPYTFGLLLGDGCFRTYSCYFTQADEDIAEEKAFIPYSLTKWSSKYAYRIGIPNWGTIIREYELYHVKSEGKFIPDEFKYNSREVRLNLLKGLLDSDGHVHGGVPSFSTVSERLRDDVIEVARSLGYHVFYVKKRAGYKINGIYKECLPCYEVSIYAGPEIFNLTRKKAKVKYIGGNAKSRRDKVSIVNIEYLGITKCKCVTVDAPDECYLIGDFVTTHNCSKSYSLASMMAKNLILGESTEVCKRVTTVLTAYQKEYLADKDGTLSKFEPMINFVSENTEFPRLRLRSSSQDMFWQMGYIDNYGRKKGSLNSVMGVSSKDDSGKLRGKRGHIYFEEMGSFPNLLEIFDVVRQGMEEGDYTYGLAFLVGCVCKGTLVCKPNGEQIPIEKLTPEDGIVGFNKESFTLTNEPISNPIKPEPTTCYRITLSNNNILECSWDHPILVAVIHTPRINGTNRRNIYYSYEWKLAKDITHKDKICESRVVGVFGKEKLFDARLVGMLIGDGSYGIHNSIKYSSQDYELQNYIESKYDAICTRGHITKNGKSYKEYRIRGLCQGLRESGIYGQTRTNKRLPSNYQKLDRENTILLLSGLYDTDGTICYKEQRSSLEITQSNETILKEINILWRKFGVYGSIQKVNPVIREGRKDKNPWYNLIIAGSENLTRALSVLSPLIGYKKESSTKILNFYKNYQYKCVSNIDKSIICHHAINVECIGIKEVYHLTTDNTHTYLANGIITHNTAAEKESNFESAKTLLYNTEVYNIYTIKNVYDKPKQGKPTFGYFFPAYVNRKGCYNKDGVSDVVKALVQILQARYKAKYGSDPNSVLRVIAEMPITPAEAIIKVKNAFFPVTALTERLQQIDLDSKAYDDVKVGNLVLEGNEVKFRPSDDKPIRKYGVDNSTQGAIEIYEVPQRNSSNKVYDNRYIIGHDPVDNDQAESHSLSSTFVLDLYTDRIVAEYTGRQPFADDNFEIVRLLCLFYNAKCLYESNKKGIFAYFQKLQCTHLLADTPEYLRDKQMVKYSSFGSNAKGVNTSAAINNYANGLIRDWLLKPIPTIIVEDGVEKQVQVSNLYFIRGRALLEELIAFDPVRNFDRIRALGMLMLYREEKIILYGSNLNAESAEKADKSYLGNDDFFKRNYDNVGVPFVQ